jgi:hypothetical protein
MAHSRERLCTKQKSRSNVPDSRGLASAPGSVGAPHTRFPFESRLGAPIYDRLLEDYDIAERQDAKAFRC